jgi:hypothetical protein
MRWRVAGCDQLSNAAVVSHVHQRSGRAACTAMLLHGHTRRSTWLSTAEAARAGASQWTQQTHTQCGLVQLPFRKNLHSPSAAGVPAAGDELVDGQCIRRGASSKTHLHARRHHRRRRHRLVLLHAPLGRPGNCPDRVRAHRSRDSTRRGSRRRRGHLHRRPCDGDRRPWRTHARGPTFCEVTKTSSGAKLAHVYRRPHKRAKQPWLVGLLDCLANAMNPFS